VAPGKTKFVRDRLYKATRQIIIKHIPDYKRLKLIMYYGKKSIDSIDAHVVDSRETDMPKRVMAVKASIGSKTSLVLFGNISMKDYIKKLDPKHTPPHRLERIRITEVMIYGAFMEFHHINKV
jgi:hypothetical protein